MQVWSVYMIKTRMNTLYTGVSTDVSRRFNEHCEGSRKGARYLKGKAPLELVWQRAALNKRQAMQLEYRIKQLPRATKDRLVLGRLQLTELFPDLCSEPLSDGASNKTNEG